MPRIQLTPQERRELQTIAEGARDRRVLRRVLVLLELDAGERPTHLAKRFRVCRSTIYNWASRLHQQDGPLTASFEDRPRPGRPPISRPSRAER